MRGFPHDPPTTAALAFDATGHPLAVGDRVGSFNREVPGTIERIRADLEVRHDGDAAPTAYLMGSTSRTAPGVFKLNLSAAERAL